MDLCCIGIGGCSSQSLMHRRNELYKVSSIVEIEDPLAIIKLICLKLKIGRDPNSLLAFMLMRFRISLIFILSLTSALISPSLMEFNNEMAVDEIAELISGSETRSSG